MIRIRAKTIDGRYWQPETKQCRTVPISQALRGYLDRWTAPASDHGWLFPSPEGKWWDPDNFSTDLRNANHQHGLPWGCLDYRHTFGSQLTQRGIGLFKISTLLGNSPDICRRHYAALQPDHLNADVNFHQSHNMVADHAI